MAAIKGTNATSTAVSQGVRTVTIDGERAGQRLDNFLLGQFKGAPRSLIYRLLRTGQVRINGKRVKPDRRLEENDQVRLPPVRLDAPADHGSPHPALLAQIEASIVFEDRALLVLDKPSGIASHGGSGIGFGAIELMRALRPKDSLELVHRLDRDTSGILVLAKKRSALTELQALIRAGKLEKRYLALLVGQMGKPLIHVDAPLEKFVLQGGERMVRVLPSGKASLSHFKQIERLPAYTYAEIKIDTGRTHQIRVHGAHIGHPVAGDEKYGDKAANQALKSVGLQRLFLHAASLKFALKDGAEPYLLSTPLPAALKVVIDRLGAASR
ncbi:MAG: RluA family pseudouridine synthase [Pseudomarimonas sp.]